MGRVKTTSCPVAKGASELATVGRAQSVAVVLDEPQVVPPGHLEDCAEVERIAKRVREEDSPRARPDSFFQAAYVQVAARQRHVEKNRNAAVLEDRVDRRRKG